MNNENDIELTINEIEKYLKLPIERIPEKDGCKHKKVLLDCQQHRVICKDCHKDLDAFWYLELLASEWSIRRYHDAAAIHAYNEIKKREKAALLRGKHIMRPLSPEGGHCWDIFTKLKGETPDYVYFHGGWYAGYNGGCESVECLELELRRKLEKLKEVEG
jgi:hypothetical protein